MKLIYIEWADASHREGWLAEDDPYLEDWLKVDGVFVKMVGWLVKETKREIVLAMGIHKEDDYTPNQFLTIHKIPKGWIRKRKVIKL